MNAKANIKNPGVVVSVRGSVVDVRFDMNLSPIHTVLRAGAKAEINIAKGGGRHPARNIVDGDFLLLVRLGVRVADDPLIVDSVAVMGQVLKRDLPQGPGWRRDTHDGYGQKADGSAYNGTGEGRCWPILTGERAHYEPAAGRDSLPFIEAMEKFANVGGMSLKQLWDADDLPDVKMKRGSPTGAAMPLCWSHAEYVRLVRPDARRTAAPHLLWRAAHLSRLHR